MEILVCFAIVIGLLVAGVPLARDFWGRNQVDTRVNTMINAIKYAQIQARLKNQELVLQSLSGKQGWSKGMRLFVDLNHNRRFDRQDSLIREWHWGSKVLITWQGFSSDNYLLFTPQLSKAALSGHFKIGLIEDKAKGGKKIVINRFGRIRVLRI